MRLRGRVTRLEAPALDAVVYRQATRLAAERNLSVDKVLAEHRRLAGWLARDRLLHPRPLDASGRVDIEPSLRRMATELGLDPEKAVAAARRILEEEGLV